MPRADRIQRILSISRVLHLWWEKVTIKKDHDGAFRGERDDDDDSLIFLLDVFFLLLFSLSSQTKKKYIYQSEGACKPGIKFSFIGRPQEKQENKKSERENYQSRRD